MLKDGIGRGDKIFRSLGLCLRNDGRLSAPSVTQAQTEAKQGGGDTLFWVPKNRPCKAVTNRLELIIDKKLFNLNSNCR